MTDRQPAVRASNQKPSVWVISGPSGVGKGTVCALLREQRPDLLYSVSMTTRDPRPGEVDGVSYHFVSAAHFSDLASRGLLLEHAVVHGTHSYGTPRPPVDDALAQGRSVVLEIDMQGARQVKRNMPEAQLVFLKPPSWEELTRRLVGRGTEDGPALARRLETARAELAASHKSDHVIVNDEVEDTVATLIGLMSL